MHTWAPNITGEKMEIKHFSPTGDRTRSAGLKSPTLYHVAIKAGLYRKAVQVYYIPIPGDKNIPPLPLPGLQKTGK